MARNLALKTNVEPADSDYPYGKIKDDSGVGDGTPVNELVYGDMHQFFARMFAKSGLVYNNLPDSDYSDFQFFEAAQKLWKKFGGVNYITSTGTTYLTRDKYDLCHVIDSTANNIVWLYDDTVLEDGDTVNVYNHSNYTVRINASSANILGSAFIFLYATGDFISLVYDKANTKWVYASKKITTLKTAFSTATPEATGDFTVPATVGGDANVFQYRLNNQTNEIEFRGFVQKGVAAGAGTQVIYILPIGQRPLNNRCFVVSDPTAASSSHNVIVNDTGEITSQPGNNVIISMDTIKFSLD